jgi:hypothetical protein
MTDDPCITDTEVHNIDVITLHGELVRWCCNCGQTWRLDEEAS